MKKNIKQKPTVLTIENARSHKQTFVLSQQTAEKHKTTTTPMFCHMKMPLTYTNQGFVIGTCRKQFYDQNICFCHNQTPNNMDKPRLS